MRYPKYLISIILFFILATSNVWANQTVQLLSKRHRTEKNWVEYRISLKNTSENPIVNPDIHYYASDTVLSVTIDYISNPYTVTPSVTPVSSPRHARSWEKSQYQFSDSSQKMEKLRL